MSAGGTELGEQRFSVSAFMLLTRPQQPHADSCWDLPQAFNGVFEKAIQRAIPSEDIRQRVINLTDQITYSVYVYTAQGLFERDKLIFLAQVAFQVIPTNVWDIPVAFRQLVLWCCYGC